MCCLVFISRHLPPLTRISFFLQLPFGDELHLSYYLSVSEIPYTEKYDSAIFKLSYKPGTFISLRHRRHFGELHASSEYSSIVDHAQEAESLTCAPERVAIVIKYLYEQVSSTHTAACRFLHEVWRIPTIFITKVSWSFTRRVSVTGSSFFFCYFNSQSATYECPRPT